MDGLFLCLFSKSLNCCRYFKFSRPWSSSARKGVRKSLLRFFLRYFSQLHGGVFGRIECTSARFAAPASLAILCGGLGVSGGASQGPVVAGQERALGDEEIRALARVTGFSQ